MSVWAETIRRSDLPPMQRHLLRVLGEFADDPDGWPTTQQVADSAGCRYQSAYLNLRALMAEGWVAEVTGRPRRKYRPALPVEVMQVLVGNEPGGHGNGRR